MGKCIVVLTCSLILPDQVNFVHKYYKSVLSKVAKWVYEMKEIKPKDYKKSEAWYERLKTKNLLFKNSVQLKYPGPHHVTVS